MADRPGASQAPDMEGPGSMLRRAREARGLVIRDVALELHLDEWMLQALEEDDFPALGAPVFAKGHMRKYGSMLGLDTDDLMIAYYRKRGRDDTPPPITTLANVPADDTETDWSGLRWIGLGALILAALAMLYLYWSGLEEPEALSVPAEPASQPSVSNPAPEEIPLPAVDPADSGGLLAAPVDGEPSEPAALPGDGADDSNDGADVSAIPEGSSEPAAVAETEEVSPPPVPQTIQVTLSLDGDSWVEVTDSTGSRLVYDMIASGRVRQVEGRPPIEIFLGRARAVRLQVDGEDYAVPRSAVRGNTARFVIGEAR